MPPQPPHYLWIEQPEDIPTVLAIAPNHKPAVRVSGLRDACPADAASAAAQEAAAAESAIQSVIHGDVNASSFQIPGTEAGHDDIESSSSAAGGAATEGVLITEEPLRADLFIVLGAMWIGESCSNLL